MEGGLEITVVGDRRLVLEAIAAALSARPGIAARWCDAAGVRDTRAGAWLVDAGPGLAARLALVRDSSAPGAPVFVLVPDGSTPIFGAECVGANDGLDALAARVQVAVAQPVEGAGPQPAECPLSARELTVLGALAGGMHQDAVASALGVSGHTVRTHIQHAIVKLGVHSRRGAIDVARDAGWLPPDGGGHGR